MNQRHRSFVLWGCLFLAVLVGNGLIVVSHEQAHQAVLAYFGVDSVVEYGFFGFGARTVPLEEVPGESEVFVAALNSLNEVFGYQLLAAFNALVFCMVLLFAMFDFRGGGGSG